MKKMKYELNGIPFISDLYGYQIDKVNNRVICSANGQIKIINCDPNILQEVLSYVNGINTFEFIEKKFIERYRIDEIRYFLGEILKEKIIEQIEAKSNTNKEVKILVIGEGVVGEMFKDCRHIVTDTFLLENLSYNFDVVIIAPSKITYSKMLEINKKLYNMKKPYIQITYNGSKVSVGPLVIPNKSACLECGISYEIKRLNTKSSNEHTIDMSDLGSLNYCCNFPEKLNTINLSYVVSLLRNDITNYFNGYESLFLDVQYFFDLNSINYHREQRLATTYCNCCNGFNNNYVKFDVDTMNFETLLNTTNNRKTACLSKLNIKYNIGGFRSKSEAETKELLKEDLDKLGAKVRIEPAYGNPFNDNNIVHCYNSYVEQINIDKMPYLFRKNQAAGKGLTKSQSYFSAAFELLEHMSLQYTGDIPIICAKYKDVKSIAIDMPYLANTIKNKNTAFDDFDEETEIDWVIATSLTNESKKMVPAFLVFMHDIELKGNLFGTTSSGAGAGTTIEDAILHGLFESLERDAWLIGQSNPYILPIVDYESINNPKIKKIISRINQLGYEIITRDYTNDLTIPVFRTWIYNKNDYSKYAYMGLGCHMLPEIALERSITEVVQIDDWSNTGCDIDSDMITLPVLDSSLVNLYNQHYLVNKDILGKTDKKTIISESTLEIESTYEAIKRISKLIKEKNGGDLYYIEMTKPGMNVKVARVIITGDFQYMNIPLLSASKRIFEFGIRCGYSDTKTSYEELFMGKYQH